MIICLKNIILNKVNWLKSITIIFLKIKFTSSIIFSLSIEIFQLITIIGACMLNEKQMQERIRLAKTQGIPFTNYGIVIAYLNGILARSIEPIGL